MSTLRKYDEILVNELYDVLVPKFLMDSQQTRKYIVDVLNYLEIFKPISYIFAHNGDVIYRGLYDSRNSQSCSIDGLVSSIPIEELAFSLYVEAPNYVLEYVNDHPEIRDEYYEQVSEIINRYIINHRDYRKFKHFICGIFELHEESTLDEIENQITDFLEKNNL